MFGVLFDSGISVPSLKLGTRDLKAKSGRDFGLKVCAGDKMPNITLGVTVSVGL